MPDVSEPLPPEGDTDWHAHYTELHNDIEDSMEVLVLTGTWSRRVVCVAVEADYASSGQGVAGDIVVIAPA